MTRNNADFHGITPTYSRLPTEHQVTITLGNNPEPIGHIRWSDIDQGNMSAGEITDIFVHPDHRRQKYATRLFNYAKAIAPSKYAPTPILSKEMTDDGKHWAKTVGG